MEFLHNGFTLNISPGGFPLSTDSMLLSDFIRLPKQAAVLDLGSGCGTLGLLLCAKDPNCTVTGVELDPHAHQAAEDNISCNQLASRLFSICGDLRTIPETLPAGSFSCCISNPPYYRGGPSSTRFPNARRNDNCTVCDLFTSAAWGLRWGGDFFLVHKPEYLAELCAQGSLTKLEPKRLRLVRHHPGSPVSLILLQFKKGAKPGLTWEELCLFDPDGSPSQAYRKIYHLE